MVEYKNLNVFMEQFNNEVEELNKEFNQIRNALDNYNGIFQKDIISVYEKGRGYLGKLEQLQFRFVTEVKVEELLSNAKACVRMCNVMFRYGI